MAPTLAPAEIDALARAMHADPFAVLGPHDVDGGVAIRVDRVVPVPKLRPRARSCKKFSRKPGSVRGA